MPSTCTTILQRTTDLTFSEPQPLWSETPYALKKKDCCKKYKKGKNACKKCPKMRCMIADEMRQLQLK